MSDRADATFSAMSRLLRRLNPPWRFAGVAICLMLVAGPLEGATVGMLVPLLSMLTGGTSGVDMFSRVLPLQGGFGGAHRVAILGTAIWFVVLLKNVVNYFAVSAFTTFRMHVLDELRRQLLRRVLHGRPSTLEAMTTGEIASAFLSDAARLSRALDYLIALVQRTVLALAYLAAVFVLSWRLTLLTLLLGGLLGALSLFLSRRALSHGRAYSRASLELGRQVTETVGGQHVVRVTASEAIQEQKFAESNEDLGRADAAAGRSLAVLAGAMETLGAAGAMMVIALAYSVMLSRHTLDVSLFLAFCFGLVRLLPALNQVYSMQGALTTYVGNMEKLLHWLDLPLYPTRPFGDQPLEQIREGITFERLSFEYRPGQPVLDDLSFHLPAGSTLALVGASGSGKSTLASLLLRLREPTGGRILIDGIDHWSFRSQDYHRTVAFVEQEPFMFNASIAENVAYGAPGVTRDDIWRALDAVQLKGWAEQLPEGVNTVVGERGATVSGGQRQRLAIARAIVRNPDLLIMDEPTSSLDPATEEEVVKAMDAARVGRTTIIITHRMATTTMADQTLQLAKGRIVYVGRPGAQRSAAVRAE